MASLVNKFTHKLLASAFPNYCLFCGLPSCRNLALCEACEGDLPRNHYPCPRCALPLAPTEADARRAACGNCLRSPPPFTASTAPWVYDPFFAHLIGRWKDAGEQGFSGLLAQLWLNAASDPGEVDLLVPVPLHWRKRWQRGFNQAELFAQALLCLRPALGQLDTALVRRRVNTGSQRSMTARHRRTNLSNAFTTRRSCDNLRIAIIDDVMTTGATARSLATVLAAAGASHIEVWCIARTPTPGS